AGGDDDPEAPVFERPRCVFAARAATEISASEQHARALRRGAVQFEILDERAILAASPVPKEEFAEARPLDPLEKLLGDDLVGIDVGTVHRDHAASVFGKWFHSNLLPIADINEMSGAGCSCCHGGRDQVRTSAATLSTLEITVRRRRT